MVTALITGITGQDGAYLAKLLLSKDYEVYGFASRRVNQTYENLDYLGITDQVKIIFGDIRFSHPRFSIRSPISKENNPFFNRSFSNGNAS